MNINKIKKFLLAFMLSMSMMLSTVATSFADEINTYKITYNLNGGTNNKANPSSYTDESSIKLKNATKKGYYFNGWYLNNTKITSINKGSTSNKALTAKWKKVTVARVKGVTLKRSGNKLKISYKKVSGAKGYLIQYSTSSKFTSSTTKSKITSARSKTYTVTKSKKYYVRVKAYKKDSKGYKVYGKYSATKSKAGIRTTTYHKKSTKKKTTSSYHSSGAVYLSRTGSKYHSNPYCSNMKSPIKVSLSEAKSSGRTPCSKCY